MNLFVKTKQNKEKLVTLALLPFSLSQYSDENMMDPYNLAICFGPTLMPIPDGQDPVACQAHVNEVIKTIIIHHEVIFPNQRELDGPVYEKCMTGGEEYWWVYQMMLIIMKKMHELEGSALCFYQLTLLLRGAAF